MRTRKTVSIATVKAKANHYFQHSSDAYRAERRALQGFVDSLLLDADAYKGFRYLRQDEVRPDFKCGIIFDEVNGNHVYPDDSRISFY